MEDYSYISSDDDDNVESTVDIINYQYKKEDILYNESLFLLNKISEFKYYDPLILDKMTQLNFFKFLDQIKVESKEE